MKYATWFKTELHILILLAMGLLTVQAAPGDIDPTFQTRVEPRASASSVVQPDGKTIVFGDFDKFNEAPRAKLIRLNADGSIDPSFNPPAIFNSFTNENVSPSRVIIQPDGKLVIGGFFTTVDGVSRNRIARLNADGTHDLSFNPGTAIQGSGIPEESVFVFALALQPDGKILAGGFFQKYNGVDRADLVRINSNGSLDMSLDPGIGAAPGGAIFSITAQPNGLIYITGQFSSFNSVGRFGYARLLSNGSVDATYNCIGCGVVNSLVTAMHFLPDGKAIVVGNYARFLTAMGTIDRLRIARVNVDGTLDLSFDAGNLFAGSPAAAIQPDGKIVVGDHTNIFRLNPDGSRDQSYFRLGYVNGTITSLITLPDGKLLFAGNFTRNATESKEPPPILLYRNGIGRLDANGYPDITFDPGSGAVRNQSSPATTIKALKIAPDGKIYIGGEFSLINGKGRRHLARLNADGSLDDSFNPARELLGVITPSSPSDAVTSLAIQPDGKLIVGGEFGLYGTSIANRLVRFNTDGQLDSSFQTTVQGFILASEVQPDGKVIVGGFIPPFATPSNIVRFNGDGSLDSSFNVGNGTNSGVCAIARQPDGKILIAGDFTSFNGLARGRLARLNADGTLDQTFLTANAANGLISSIVLLPDGKVLIGGQFTTFNGVPTSRIARLNTNGTLDESFDTGVGPDGQITAMATQPDGKIVAVGSFGTFDGAVRRQVVRLNINGSVDQNFESDIGTGSDAPTTIGIQPNNGIVIGGSFTTFDGLPRLRIVRLESGLLPPGSLVQVSGRVLTPSGHGLTNATVTLSDSKGVTRRTISSSFGYYRFDEIEAGETYIIAVISKRYTFASRAVPVFEALSEVDFVPLE